ncbi:protein nutcracker-like [Anopheles albimanus]|uniref:Uncharacterized protein n=1 Tax=Anopheles albimanus TaxID=7167 RepID=A0A182FFK9_ANOAL|nr:protein nutcracker-like [Anopheles albimanus]
MAEEQSSMSLEEEPERSRSPLPLPTVAEEGEGYQPVPVKPWTDWDSMQLLVEDSNLLSLAPTLEATLRYFITHYPHPITQISKCDLITLAICVVAFETGLSLDGCPLPPMYKSNQLSTYRSFDNRLVRYYGTHLPMAAFANRSKAFSLDLCLLPGGALEDVQRCALVAFDSSDLLIVSLIPAEGSSLPKGFSSALPISRYIPLVNIGRLTVCFQRMKELSRKLKDELFLPFRDIAYDSYQAFRYPSLMGLPEELKSRLVKYMDKSSQENLRVSYDESLRGCTYSSGG